MKMLKHAVVLLIGAFWFVFVLNAEATTNSGYSVYLPIVMKPPFIVANFDSCTKFNNLGGEMGAAYKPTTADRLFESYELETGRGCVAKLDYKIPTEWSAFWLKLLNADLTRFQTLSFDVKFIGQANPNTNMEIKVELKRGCQNQECNEVWIQYVPITTDTWTTVEINLADFAEDVAMPPPLPPLTDIEELVFTFQKGRISSEGLVFLDNIIFKP